MPTELQIQVPPSIAADPARLKKKVAQKARIPQNDIQHLQILKRSIDARQKAVKINLKVAIYTHEKYVETPISLPDYPDVSNAPPVIIVGAGPAGLFAALRLVEQGLKPIVIERGKAVRERRRDLAAITRKHLVNEDSNYCFGEGGAGTYSDGKLYTRSKKRGDVNRILKLLVAHGASRDILVDAHPHIGTNKLPHIVTAIRNTIKQQGGEVHFEERVTDLLVHNKTVQGVKTAKGNTYKAKQVILATGHSARDIFTLLYQKNILIEAKPFALGVRVEHSQQLIDQIRYKCADRGTYLPPAAYSIVKQVRGRGVYSFCMCPGGIIAPCATAPGEVVTNGWSPSKRDQATSNSGIVVELRLADFQAYAQAGPLAGVEFQKAIEQKAWLMGGQTQRVPAQRLIDFTQQKKSASIPKTSYYPGTNAANLKDLLPSFIYHTLRGGFLQFAKSLPGYLTNEAIIHAPESRTSSPVRIPRDPSTLEHVEIQGLYPCGEGAGYAGGIISAAIDGEKCAEKCSIQQATR